MPSTCFNLPPSFVAAADEIDVLFYDLTSQKQFPSLQNGILSGLEIVPAM